MLGLINDVLDMSKIESGKLTLTLEAISLKEVVEGVVGIIQPQIKTKKQNFDVHIENITVENVYCDSVRLNQVLLNLLSNATKYTPEGGSIQLSLFEEASPRGENFVRTHLKVKDNGIGMSPEFCKGYTNLTAVRMKPESTRPKEPALEWRSQNTLWMRWAGPSTFRVN